MAKFKYKKDFKSERSSSRDSRPERPFKRFDSSSKFGDDRPKRFSRDEPSHRSSRLLELFDSTCARCGKACQLPFRPTNNKPVYCRECFKKNDAPSSDRFERSDSAPRRFDRSEGPSPRKFEPRSDNQDTELQKINRKLDKIMEALDID